MKLVKKQALGLMMVVVLALSSAAAVADQTFKRATTLDALLAIDGAQALVAVVQVVDEAGTLPFSLAELFADKRTQTILFAPSNSAFEDLLGLESGALDGLSVDEISDAILTGAVGLPEGVDLEDVQQILLQHASIPEKFKSKTTSIAALIEQGKVLVADGSELPVGVGGAGGRINYESNVTLPDLFTRNGVIHFIDTVIIDDALNAPTPQ